MSATSLVSYLYPALLYFPAQAIYNIYQQFTIPSMIEQTREPVRIDPGQRQPLVTDTLKREIEPLLDQEGIMKNIVFYEVDKKDVSAVGALAIGSDLCKGAFICITKGFYEVDREACSFAVKHEIGHIKYNDCITRSSITAISQIAAISFGLLIPSFSLIHIILLTELVGIIAGSLLEQLQEAKADDFAIQHSSNQELVGGIRFFTTLQEKYIEKRNAHLWNRIFYSNSGENRLDISHPSLASRIQKIQDTLRAREAAIDIVDQPNLNNLRAVLFT